jgi:hypothetical protein
MNVGASQAALRAAQSAYAERPGTTATNASVEMLKKSLESEREAAQTLLKTLEPKGRLLDVRA